MLKSIRLKKQNDEMVFLKVKGKYGAPLGQLPLTEVKEVPSSVEFELEQSMFVTAHEGWPG